MVSSSKYALWTVFTQAGSFSPKWESPWSKCALWSVFA